MKDVPLGERKPFKLIRQMSRSEFDILTSDSINTSHWALERYNRFEYLEKNAEPIEGFIAIVDKCHENGPEVHALFTDGSIRIYNYASHRFITALLARPAQAKRIMNTEIYSILPCKIYTQCRDNIAKGRNYM